MSEKISLDSSDHKNKKTYEKYRIASPRRKCME